MAKCCITRRTWRRAALAALAVGLLGCDQSVEKYQPEPNVYCVLRTDRPYALLLAGMTTSFDDTTTAMSWQGTAGVTADIQRGTRTWHLAARGDSAGFYQADSVSVMPGDSFRLNATYPGGKVVRGSTRVPDTFRIASVRVDTTQNPWDPGVVLIGFHWHATRSAGAAGYYFSSSAYYGSESLGGMASLSRVDPSGDSAGVPSMTFRLDTLTGGLDTLYLTRFTMLLRAVDRNYDDYLMQWYFGQSGGEDMHLDGGVGVFGAATVVETTFVFAPPR